MKIALLAVAAVLSAGISIGAWYVAQSGTQDQPEPEKKAEVKIVDPTYKPAKPSCSSCGDARHPTPPL